MDISLSERLEQVAIELREILGFDKDAIITFYDKEYIINSIKRSFSNYDIKYSFINTLKLVNRNKYLITISREQSLEEQFDYLLVAFCYSLLLDEKLLNQYKLKEYALSNFMYDEEARYLKDAFLMPKDLYLRELTLNSSNDGHVYIDDMEKKFCNKYVMKRGHDLRLF